MIESFVYKWVNVKNGHEREGWVYVGRHTGEREDGYVSSSFNQSFWDDYYNGYLERTIIAGNLTVKEAIEIERQEIDKIWEQCKKYNLGRYNLQRGHIQCEWTPEAREKMSKSKTGKKLSEESKAKLRATKASRKHLHKKRKSRVYTDAERQKISKIQKGMHWYNNGVINTRARVCPEGFVPGAIHFEKLSEVLKGKNEWVKGRKHFTNGEKNIMAFVCPEGFWPGRTFKRKKIND